MKARFYFLALLSGLFLIVALPLGIAFLFFVALYYLSSHKEEDIIHFVASNKEEEEEDTVHFVVSKVETPSSSSDPDFNDLFNDEDFVREQEKLR